MKIEELEKLITELAVTSEKSKEEMIQELADFAKSKFNSILKEDEEKVIKLIQEKLIIGLYKMANHSYVSNRPDYKEKFGFDDLEMKHLEQSANELGDLDILEGSETYTKLTDKGILKAKKLLGEI